MNKILVINNDLDSIDLLKSWLETKSFDVKITTCGEDVPRLMQEFKPAIVMADIIQKQVITDLKEKDKTRDIPVLLMSGYTKRQETVEFNADDVIEKPFNLPLLEYKLHKLLKKKANLLHRA